MTLSAIVGVALVHLLAAMSPGPSFVLSIRTAATEGFRPAACLALGFGFGAMLWAFGALAGLALLFEIVPPLFVALKVAGGIFLVYLAYSMWRHAPDPMPVIAPDAPPRGAAAAIRLGLASMLANPKPAVFFGAVFVGLVPPSADMGDRTIILLNILWVETAWYLVVARLFSLERARRAYGRAKTVLDRVFGSILGALGVKVAVT
ncbi:threonine/homoserine/homoserine lactone efflux protein [Palleronia aestuarii]|uniref:Threonine/homoserine/homoserine lactone efflux protein n=1 Tax=Palleronia aestuarii TaxID=568105 RepID=A0A2W7NKS8_9RHOB|nr:LysE family transporter [Palleronia aestuarii]PZX13796.1 threonine/homoserine/homoserine lactone efflux protein [Palleronia aestuarii]